jgi:predicted transcriptional regulator
MARWIFAFTSEGVITMIKIIPTTIEEINKLLDGEIICGEDKVSELVKAFAASDLMSDLLAMDLENYALLTALNNSQVVRTADITNAACIVILRGKKPDLNAITIARQSGIPMIVSNLSIFEACTKLGSCVENC